MTVCAAQNTKNLMLNLSVSSQRCLPGRTSSIEEPRPCQCATCGAPGGQQGQLLEGHIIGKNKRIYLCPYCHVCLHLDIAGRMSAGKIIWLPELSQTELNILCLASFVALRKAGVYRKNAPTQVMCEQIIRLYKTFEKRSEAVENFLSGNLEKSFLTKETLSSPTFLASLILRAQRDSKLDAKTLANKVDGLRLLITPQAFDGYVAQVSRLATADYPVVTWMESVEVHLRTIDAAMQSRDELEGTFDADLANEF